MSSSSSSKAFTASSKGLSKPCISQKANWKSCERIKISSPDLPRSSTMKKNCSVRPPFGSSSLKSSYRMTQSASAQKSNKDFSASIKTSIHNQSSSSAMKEKNLVKSHFVSPSVKSSFRMNQGVLVQKPKKDFSESVKTSIRNPPSSSINKEKGSTRSNFYSSSVESSSLAKNKSVTVCKPKMKFSESIKISFPGQSSSPLKKGRSSTKPGFLSSSMKSSFLSKSRSVSRVTFNRNKAERTAYVVPERKKLLSKSADSRKVLVQEEAKTIFLRKGDDIFENSISNSLVNNMLFEEVVAAPEEIKLGSEIEVDTCALAVSTFMEPSVLSKDASSSNCGLVGIDHSMVIGHDKDNENNTSQAPEVEIGHRMVTGHNEDNENNISQATEDGSPSPQLSARLRDVSNILRDLHSHVPLSLNSPIQNLCSSNIDANIEPKTPEQTNLAISNTFLQTCIEEPKAPQQSEAAIMDSPWQTFSAHSLRMMNNMTRDYMTFLNFANKVELMKIKGIGQKRASYILELREVSPEPFKNLDDLKRIGLSTKQINGMMKHVAGDVLNQKEQI